MKLDGGEHDKRSIVGGLGSLVLMATMGLFAYQKADVLVLKKDVDILSTINDMAFDPDYVFNYEMGFNIAMAFTAYDSNPEEILVPEIGEIKFNHFSWGAVEDGISAGRTRIPHHNCSPEELGLVDNGQDQARFLPVYPTSLSEVKFY